MSSRAKRTRRSLSLVVSEVLEQRRLLSATLDNSFGGDGKVEAPEGFFTDTAITTGGKLVALYDDDGSRVTRYNSNGEIDMSFGGGDGVAEVPFFGRTVEVQSDGKIVVGGAAGDIMNATAAIARLNADGSPDTTFGNNGALVIPRGFTVEAWGGINDVEVLSDGSIVAAGTLVPQNNSSQLLQYTAFKFTPTGQLDSTFSRDGITHVTTVPWESGGAHKLSVRPDGKLVLIGTQGANDDILIARINADGYLDGSFGAQGTVRLPGTLGPLDIETQFGNKAVVGLGESVIRLNASGTTDSTFKTITYQRANGRAFFDDIEIAPDNDILMAGSLPADIADGSYIATFFEHASDGTPQQTLALFGNSNATSLDIAGGKALVGGHPRMIMPGESPLVLLARLNLDGTGGGGGGGTGLTGTYFDNDNFTNPKFTRVDSTINFDWGGGSPSTAIAPDTFSVRWTGKITAPASGTWTFYVPSDDRAKLTIGGVTVVDYIPGRTPSTGTITLQAGVAKDVVLEYREFGGNARASLQWSGPGVTRRVVPTSALTPGTVTPPPPSSRPTFDNSFGGDGTVQGERGFVADAAMTPDGGVVVLVEQHKLYRFKANGDVDLAFGGGDGVIDTIPFARAVEVQADGRIVVGGSAGNVFSPGAAIGRYNADGTPDTSFSEGGVLIIEGGFAVEAFSVIDDLEILSDGRIVASGSLVPPNNTTQSTQPTVFRITSSGELDRTFNRDGIATIPISAHAFGSATSLSVRPDGKLAVVGFINEDDAFATRVNTDGYLDGSFGIGGIVMLDSPRPPEDVEVQFGNKTLISDGIKIIRLNPNGTIDAAFKTIDKSAGATSPPPYLPDLEVRANNELAVLEVLGNNTADGSTHTDFVQYSANGDRLSSLAIPWGSHTRAVALELQGSKAVLAGQGHQFLGEADRISISKLILDGSGGA